MITTKDLIIRRQKRIETVACADQSVMRWAELDCCATGLCVINGSKFNQSETSIQSRERI